MSQPVVDVPSCALINADAYNSAQAAGYDLRQWSFYKGYLSTVLPGVIVGGVCLLVGLIYMLWLCSLCCRARSWSDRKRRERHASGEHPRGKFRSCGWVTDLLVLLLVLGVCGVSAWGLYESIKTTDGKVDEFWSVVASGQVKVENVSDTTSRIVNEVAQLQSTVTSVSAALPAIASRLPQLNGTAIDVSSLQSVLDSAGTQLQQYVDDGRAAVNSINTDGVQALQNMQVKYKAKSQHVQRVWRYVALAILFGLLVIFAILAGVCAVIGRLPRLTATALCLLWICTGLTLIWGAGGMIGAYRVSNQTCLYAETFVLKVAAEKTNANPQVEQGLQYYFGAIQIPSDQVAKQVYGLDINAIHQALSLPDAQALLTFLSTSEGTTVVTEFLNMTADVRQNIVQFPNTVLALNSDLGALEAEIQVGQFSGLHDSIKQLICCDLSSLLRKLFIAWTIAGSLAALLAILVTGKVIASVGPTQRAAMYRSADHPVGAVSGVPGWTPGYPAKSAV